MRLIPITAQQAQSYQMGQSAPEAALQQPGASLQQTQTSTAATGAEIPGIQAESGIKQIQQQQAGAQINLGNDLKNKMTLGSALKKYTSLGMSADDIFKQYLSQSPWGMPNENPQQLQNLGIKPETLGQIGIPGSFMDRYNTKNAIQGLRNLENLWNQTSSLSKLPFLGGATASGKAYESARQIFGEHLSSLIPGASGAASSVDSLLNTLPNVGDASELNPDAASSQFKAVEDQLLTSKGYKPPDLGISSRKNQTPQKGGDILTTLMGSAINSAQDIGTGIRSNQEQPVLQKKEQQASQLESEAQNTASPTLKKILLGEANQIRTATGKEASDISKSFSPDVNQNPLLRALTGATEIGTSAELPFLPKDLIGGGANLMKNLAGKGGGETAAEVASLNGNPLVDLINPKGIVTRGGNFRNAIISDATTAGKTINGDDIVASLEKTAQTLKRGNLGQGDIVNQSITDAKEAFGGQKLTPKEAANAYAEADNGFTKAGVAKSTIQSNIDRNLRDVLGKHLEDVAPGWNKGTETMAKGYKAAKSPTRKFVGRAAGLGLGVAGLDEIRRLFGVPL